MAPFKQGSSKFQSYMIQLVRKLHDAEEMLLSGDERHLEELKQIAEMIEQYANEAQGHKFEPAQYRNVQGNPQGQQAFYDYPEYPQMPRRGQDTRGHIGYVPYYPSYPFYPFFNEGQGGQGGGSGGSSGGSGGSQGRRGGGNDTRGFSNESY